MIELSIALDILSHSGLSIILALTALWMGRRPLFVAIDYKAEWERHTERMRLLEDQRDRMLNLAEHVIAATSEGGPARPVTALKTVKPTPTVESTPADQPTGFGQGWVRPIYR